MHIDFLNILLIFIKENNNIFSSIIIVIETKKKYFEQYLNDNFLWNFKNLNNEKT